MFREIWANIINNCNVDTDYKNLLFVNKQYMSILYNSNMFVQLKTVEDSMGIYKCIDRKQRLYLKMYEACEHNYIEYVKYLIHEYNLNIHKSNEFLFRICCKYDHLDLAKYLINLGIQTNNPIDIHAYDDKFDDDVLTSACINNSKMILTYLLKYTVKKNCHFQSTVLSRVFLKCCDQNLFDVSKQLVQYSIDTNNIINRKYYDTAFIYCCRNNAIEFIDYLFALSVVMDLHINIHVRDDQVFYEACTRNNIDMIKYLVNLGEKLNSNFYVRCSFDAIFKLCCYHGYTDLLKYLVEKHGSIGKINVHVYNDYGFIIACEKNHIEMVQYLIELTDYQNQNKIQDSRPCPRSGRLEKNRVYDSVFSLPINIHIRNDHVFRFCCKFKYVELANYIYRLSLNPKYGTINSKLLKKNARLLNLC